MLRATARAGSLLSITAALIVGGRAVSSAQTSPSSSLDAPGLDIRRVTLAAMRASADASPVPPRASASQSAGAAWNRVRALPLGAKVQVEAVNGMEAKGRLQSVADDAIVVATGGGDLRVLRADVQHVRVPSVFKRIVYGTAGTITGQLVPLMACPYCDNEGHSTTRMRFVFAGVGSLMFLAPRTSTIYKAPVSR